MKITIYVNASSATLRSSLRELERQWDAMSARYPDMQRRGKIAGAEAERRLHAHRVAMDAVAELARLAAEAEAEGRSTKDEGRRMEAEDGLE